MRRFENSETSFIQYRDFLKMLEPSADISLDALLSQLRVLIAKAASKGVDCRTCFEHFDSDFSGLIDRGEFRIGIQRLEIPLSEAQIELIFDRFSKHGAAIRYEEFLRLLKPDTENQKLIDRLAQRLQLMIVRDSSGGNLRDQFLLFE